MLTTHRHRRALAVVATVGVIASACASDTIQETTSTMADMPMDTNTDTDTDMDMPMNMGDPDATPAAEVDGAELSTGTFELLDSRPPGYDDVAGTAWLARHDGGTTVTIEITGLEPEVEYISHVHAGPCSENGGLHFQFEEGGSVMPPNEIHLQFTADGDGVGFMTAENDRTVDERAVALVVHPIDLIDNKVACAEF